MSPGRQLGGEVLSTVLFELNLGPVSTLPWAVVCSSVLSAMLQKCSHFISMHDLLFGRQIKIKRKISSFKNT